MPSSLSHSLAFTLAVLCAASPTLAKDKKPVDPNKKICRSELPTGSRMPKTTCHTSAEWAEIDQDNANAAQSLGSTTRGSVSGQ